MTTFLLTLVMMSRRVGMAGCVIAIIWLPHLWLQFLLTFFILAICEGFAFRKDDEEPSPFEVQGPRSETIYSTGGQGD